jgi:hypothetical protein
LDGKDVKKRWQGRDKTAASWKTLPNAEGAAPFAEGAALFAEGAGRLAPESAGWVRLKCWWWLRLKVLGGGARRVLGFAGKCFADRP